MKAPFRCAAALAAVLACSSSWAATRYVNASTGTDAGSCTNAAMPCKTITYAMGQATTGAPGDEILVSPGTYNVALGEMFPIAFKSGVRLLSTGTAADTRLDASGAIASIFTIVDANSSTAIQGFTLMGAVGVGVLLAFPPSVPARGGAISITNASPRIARNVFLGNEARGPDGSPVATPRISGVSAFGGAIHVAGGSPQIVNNVFRGNRARGGNGVTHFTGNNGGSGGAGRGGAIYVEAGSAHIVNNTFHGNSATGGAGAAGALTGSGGAAEYGAVYAAAGLVANNIFVSNVATGGSSPGTPGTATAGALGHADATGNVSNNLFHANLVGNAASAGDATGANARCVATPCANAGFHSEPTNLRLVAASPAAGQGAQLVPPVDDFDGVTRPTPRSIGAFEVSEPSQLVNISTRGQVLTGNDVMIAGFVLVGGAPQTVAIVATGPSLAAFGIVNPLANPTLTLVRSSDQVVLATNDDWQTDSNAAALQAAGLAPANPLEPAILTTLSPGAYTAIVSGVGGGTGVGLVGVYRVN